MNDKRLKFKIESIFRKIKDNGMIIDYKDYSELIRIGYISTSPYSLKPKINNEQSIVYSDLSKDNLSNLKNIYEKWISDLDFLKEIKSEIRSFCCQRTFFAFNCFFKGVNDNYKTERERYSRIEKTQSPTELERFLLSHFVVDFRFFYEEIIAEIKSYSPLYLKLRFFYEHVTFKAAENERRRRIERCYHDSWSRKEANSRYIGDGSFVNICECLSCGKEDACEYRNPNPYDRQSRCVRCGEKPNI